MRVFTRFGAPLVMIVISVILFVVGFGDIAHVKTYPEVTATVTSVETEISTDADGDRTEETTVYVSYTVDGKEYNETLSNAPGEIKEGDVIAARYNPEKPERITAATKKTGIVKICIGAGVLLLGLFILLKTLVTGV